MYHRLQRLKVTLKTIVPAVHTINTILFLPLLFILIHLLFIVWDIQIHGLVKIVIREETNGLCKTTAAEENL
jgi:hypothetical protein